MSGTSTRSVLTGDVPMGGASTGGEERAICLMSGGFGRCENVILLICGR